MKKTGSPLYTNLSEYYDLMCSDIDYHEQCDTAYRLHKLFGSGGKSYLDLACGSGPHVEHFIELDYQASGLDLNGPMLNRARIRCPEAEYYERDMSSFSFVRQFDLITCFLYSLHYCYPKKHFINALENTFAALKPGGVFCFDMVDKRHIANDEGIKHGGLHDNALFEFQSRWAYSGAGDELNLHIHIERQYESNREVWDDQHLMLAITVPEVQTLLESIGFKVTLFERDFSKLLQWNGVSGNVFVVAVKPEENDGVD